MIQITKEELGEIIDLTEQMCNLDGWVKEALPLAQRRMDIITLASARPHTPTSNPCEEQGCTDIENCDEICDHSRIYSPAWVKEHDAAIRKVERERVLDKLLEWNEHDRSITEIMITRSHEWWHRRFKETIESLRSEP